MKDQPCGFSAGLFFAGIDPAKLHSRQSSRADHLALQTPGELAILIYVFGNHPDWRR
jgi:hypothetical protein